MLSDEEYRAFERAQSEKFQSAEPEERFENYERWQITRYDNNLNRWFITARHELGTQFKLYCDRGQWQGGRELENRMFEELQYKYRNHQGVRVVRNTGNENLKFWEVTAYGNPLMCVMILNGETFYYSKPHKLKDGYRYRMARR
jgi:hypothetical protein